MFIAGMMMVAFTRVGYGLGTTADLRVDPSRSIPVTSHDVDAAV